ncbi:MAG: FKBP-type peptidyl-prolyl cis-trans isomerase [Chloroflexota bacterium]
MKFFALVGIYASAAVLSACGGASPGEPSTTTTGHGNMLLTDSAKPPKVVVPPGPPPTHLIVNDIRPGSGAAIPGKGEVGIHVNYISLSYKTGKPLGVKWAPRGAFRISFGPGLEVKGWEKGLVGMKVGGRRELRVPSRLAYGQGAILYVVDLLGIKWPPYG